MSKILNKSQAEAVYSAMCALNNVGGTVSSIELRDDCGMAISVSVTSRGLWRVMTACHPTEWYANQAAFVTAYGLQ